MSLRPYIPILFCFVVLIIPKPGKFIDEDELKTFLKSSLSPFKVPNKYRGLGTFPEARLERY
jgi:hypothetical protein